LCISYTPKNPHWDFITVSSYKMPPSDTRFFTEDWIITLPSHPEVKFIRITPPIFGERIKLLANPLNHPFGSSADKEEWTPIKIEESRQRFIDQYNLSRTKYRALDVLVQIGGEIVGQGGVHEIPMVKAGLANIGLSLVESARGKGLGKATMQVLLRLSNELEVDIVHAGTMLANKPMRALAATLGFTEREEVLSIPGRGVVAELLFENVDYKKFKDLDMNVEFTGPAP
jgi:RimJ/RimL family protein N-acetyltransferase